MSQFMFLLNSGKKLGELVKNMRSMCLFDCLSHALKAQSSLEDILMTAIFQKMTMKITHKSMQTLYRVLDI